jgi:hypothetical protein
MMAKIKFNEYTQLFIRSVAILVGVVGLFTGYLFVKNVVIALHGASGGGSVWQVLVLAGVALVVGVYLIFVSYMMLKDFSARAIKHLCIVLSLFLLEFIFRHIRHVVEGYERKNEPLYDATALFVPLLAAFVFYTVCEKVVTRLTKGTKKFPGQ